ncbi:calmodulin-regulated spectrin-associated protein 3 isoform X2 [Narcine bancroftii]|uniref:calmodulin-regulated spectrin-associated protein 3 isoform X2 n=1 Tax=Narcine bancroftii TaxID=1343680 RepID=UPI00383143FB
MELVTSPTLKERYPVSFNIDTELPLVSEVPIRLGNCPVENVPEELREPFYTDQYDQEHIKPPVIRLLLSSDIYCRVCGQTLPRDELRPLQDNAAVLQALLQKGLQVMDQEVVVTEADLRKKPIKMGAHLSVIDALMTAYMMETLSGAKVAVDTEEIANLSNQGLASAEFRLLLWVDKVNQKLRDISERLHQLRQQSGVDHPNNQGIRYRKDKVLSKQTPCFPNVTQLKDLANGCAVAALIHHYCPDVLRLQDICLKETMSVADSLYNLQLIVEFTQEYLGSCYHLGLEDMLYTPPVLKINILTFVAELFWWFEILKPEFVRPREMLDLEDLPGSGPNTPIGAGSCSHLPAFLLKQPFLPVVQQLSPVRSSSGSLPHSTSMSQVDSFGKGWAKKQLKRPLSQAISFSIPFGLDSDVDVVMGNPIGLMRSVSSDNLSTNVYQPHSSLLGAPYGCADNTGGYLGKEAVVGNGNGHLTAPRKRSQLPKEHPGYQMPVENGLVDDHNNYMELPTIEEALKIIHNSDKLEPRLRPEGAPDGFFLHRPNVTEEFVKPKANSTQCDLNPSYKPANTAKDSGITAPGEDQANSGEVQSEDRNFSRDDDSVLRDNSLDSDVEDSSRPALEKDGTSKDECTSCLSSLSSQAESVTSSGSGVKMTSFAERKMKKISPAESKSTASQKTTPDSVDLNDQAMASWAQRSDESPSRNQALASEMTQLGIRLEEKRRAIEAQKKRIEAIFAKHRQRLGKSAFLQLKKKEEGRESEDSGSGTEADKRKLSLEERLSKIEDDDESESPTPSELAGRGDMTTEKREESLGKSQAEKHVKLNVPASPREAEADADVGEYNNAVARLNSALSSLQVDMQRLQQQQDSLMEKKNAQAWVIPAPKSSSQRPTRDFQPPRSTEFSSPSPSPSRKPAPSATRSPQAAQKKGNPTPPKSPRHSRPVELKIPPLTRVLTPPQNVDSLPHLRKFSPSQVTVQTKSSICFGEDQEGEMDVEARPKSRPVGPLARIGSQPNEPSSAEPVSPAFDLENEGNLRPVGPIVPQRTSEQLDGLPDAARKEYPSSVKRTSLIEIPLSSLKGPEDGEDKQEGFADSTNDHVDVDQKSVGFFFKDEAKAEEEMALKRATLMEKQQKRTEEFRKRRLWLDAEKEKEQSRQQTEEEKPEKNFIKQEYLRRQQLKVMDDLDKVLRAKSPANRGRKPRPKSSVFRDDSILSRSPVKGLLGSRLNKVYSRSTLSLCTMVNDSANSLSVKKSPRTESPSGLPSPNRLGNHNGEKDWENASTASSPASIPEYTGPKLYKEPSAKSNKYIIQNAITRCCLAGKVNEPQKNKILEEIDKSKSNHYLILFRDNSCQFRAVYTYPPESEEMHRVAGVGPKIITKNMIEGIYKYNSDRKQFTQIPSKTLSASVDAVTIQGHLWQTKRLATPKKSSK